MTGKGTCVNHPLPTQADYIGVATLAKMTRRPAGLKGLPKKERPSLNNMALLRWNEASGIYEVSVFPNGLGGINYVHVISSKYYACLLERTELECKSD
jgi:hypothetical protein